MAQRLYSNARGTDCGCLSGLAVLSWLERYTITDDGNVTLIGSKYDRRWYAPELSVSHVTDRSLIGVVKNSTLPDHQSRRSRRRSWCVRSYFRWLKYASALLQPASDVL